MENREIIVDKIQQITGLDESYSKDLEIGIYNWSIEYAGNHNMVKSWNNPKFVRMYLEKWRSIASNLDSKSYIKNTRLIQRIKNKEFLPHELAYMNPENVFPEKWREVKEQYLKKFEHAYENKQVAMTNLYRCSKCKQRQCSYYELQTRSADEPASLFILCINCGKSWRM